MSQIERTLEEERRIINAATEGPIRVVDSLVGHNLKTDTGTVGSTVARGATMPDAERLAHSWNALPLRNAQVAKVLQVLDDYEVPSKQDDVTGEICNGMERLEAMIRRAIEEAGA